MNLLIETINACNLKCRWCPRGMGFYTNDGEVIEISLFEDIVKKAKNECFTRISLYLSGEPFLNRKLADYVRIVSKHGLPCDLSTNLSLPHIPHLEEVIDSFEVGDIYVTVSGDTNEIQQIYHMRSDINIVYGHLNRMADYIKRKQPKVRVIVKFLEFSYNKHCVEILANFANSLGFSFMREKGAGNPEKTDRNYIRNQMEIDEFFDKSIELPLHRLRPGKCAMIEDNVTINHKGEVFLCCAKPYTKLALIGNYMDMSHDEIFAHRVLHPLCRECLHLRLPFTESDKKALLGVLSNDETKFDDVKIVLFGAGHSANYLLRKIVLKGLQVSYLVDNNPDLKEFKSINSSGKLQVYQVNSPDVLLSENKASLKILISSMHYSQEIEEQLSKMGYDSCIVTSL